MSNIIVVGIDGSEASKDALQWASNQAELTGASLHAVMTWDVPMGSYGLAIPLPLDLNLERDSRRVLDQTIAETLGENGTAKIWSTVVEGHPAVELLRAAEDAELLVVGSRGHGAFSGMLLGSVSEHCVAHSPCPVVVVRRSAHPA
ncbi:MAG: universal stress protein [Acidimicrobiales bacterium]